MWCRFPNKILCQGSETTGNMNVASNVLLTLCSKALERLNAGIGALLHWRQDPSLCREAVAADAYSASLHKPSLQNPYCLNTAVSNIGSAGSCESSIFQQGKLRPYRLNGCPISSYLQALWGSACSIPHQPLIRFTLQDEARHSVFSRLPKIHMTQTIPSFVPQFTITV